MPQLTKKIKNECNPFKKKKMNVIGKKKKGAQF